MLTDFATKRVIGDTLDLEEYLNEQKEQGKLEEVTNNGDGTITIEVDGYETTIREEDLKIIEMGGIAPEGQEGVREPNNSNKIRQGNELPFTWLQIAEIAKLIANNSSITNDTAEFTLVYEGEEYTIGVGDYTMLAGKRVRIIGFNHDELVDKTIYNNTNGKENNYAGITFEFLECLEQGRLNNPKKEGGWGVCNLRETLNGITLNSLENKEYIKEVSKSYVILDLENVPSSNDKLWLLACSEIWDNGMELDYGSYKAILPYGCSLGKEGEQYKYYKNIDAISSDGDSNITMREFRK